MEQQDTITCKVKVDLQEMIADYKACWTQRHEDFYSFLTEKVEEKLGKDLDCFQIMCYSIVGHGHDHIIFEVEGYEDV